MQFYTTEFWFYRVGRVRLDLVTSADVTVGEGKWKFYVFLALKIPCTVHRDFMYVVYNVTGKFGSIGTERPCKVCQYTT